MWIYVSAINSLPTLVRHCIMDYLFDDYEPLSLNCPPPSQFSNLVGRRLLEYLDTIHAIVAENERRLRHMETRARMSCHHKLREILFAFRTVYQSTSNPITYPTYFIDQTLNFVNNIRDDLPRWIHCIQSTSVMPLTTVIQSMPNYTLTSTPNDQDEFKLRIERGIVRGQQDYDISIVMWQFLTAFEFYDIRNRILRLDPMYLRLENYVLFRGTEQIKYLLSEAIDEA